MRARQIVRDSEAEFRANVGTPQRYSARKQTSSFREGDGFSDDMLEQEQEQMPQSYDTNRRVAGAIT
eukprot:2931468-Pleurochrysis_carterae.AAC.1